MNINQEVESEILKCGEKDDHPTRSYSRHGKTLLRWLIENYTTTWSVCQGEHLICEGEDGFYSSIDEAESSAIDWINQYQSPSFVKVNGANK